MIDIHSHILPHIDDGAEDVNEAKAMLTMQSGAGVNALYFTPHFYPDKCKIDVFLENRAKSLEQLRVFSDSFENCQVRLGAEVHYSEQLLSLDLRKLTLGDGDYLLLELPDSRYPAYISQFVENVQDRGLLPVLAHIERCAYFRKEPELLNRLIEKGVLAQVNIQSLFNRRDKNFSMACLQHGLAQIIASDAHNMTSRKPCMELIQRIPMELRDLHNVFSNALWENEMPPYLRPPAMRKTLFGYR